MTIASDTFNRRLEELDLSLFDEVPTQSSDGDRRSWLAVQRSVRRPTGYTYLEIGSHLGGSIQQHLVDPWCARMISIDKRPLVQPDDRGQDFHYEGNSTERMLENLRRIAPDQLDKLVCLNSDAKDVDRDALPAAADFCFIDGEHTRAAVVSDFEFCLSAATKNAAICFHDDSVTWRAIDDILSSLRERGIPFQARKLEGQTFAIFLGNCPAANERHIRTHSEDATSWLRGRRIREWIPTGFRPVARRISLWLKRRRAIG